jgi:hypothetical protein
MPEPGNTTSPIGRMSSMRSLRLKGCALSPALARSPYDKVAVAAVRLGDEEAPFARASLSGPPGGAAEGREISGSGGSCADYGEISNGGLLFARVSVISGA